MSLADLWQTNYALYFTFWDRWNNTLYEGKRRLTEAKEKQLAELAKMKKED
jgi:sterol desaturase/sphingolipid hydroxylase (fatty acid hydroxylase superfamily)